MQEIQNHRCAKRQVRNKKSLNEGLKPWIVGLRQLPLSRKK